MFIGTVRGTSWICERKIFVLAGKILVSRWPSLSAHAGREIDENPTEPNAPRTAGLRGNATREARSLYVDTVQRART